MLFRFCFWVLFAFGLCVADFTMPANITALKATNNGILVGLDNGELVLYNNESISTLATLPKISNSFEKNINSRIYQIDNLNDMSASIAEGDNLSKLILITKNNENKIINSPIHQLKQVLILDANTLLLLGPNCEVSFYDIASGKITHTSNFTISGFEKAVFSTDRKNLLIACEGGIVFYYDLEAKKLIKEEALHKDRIYDIAVYKNRLITGTPERKARYFSAFGERWYQERFPVYKVALSQSYGAYTIENSIVIIDENGNEVKKIAYNGTLLTDLEFASDDELVGAGYDKELHFWSIK